MTIEGANSLGRDTSAVKALLVVADATKLLTARQLHDGGWVCVVQDATIMGTMQELR